MNDRNCDEVLNNPAWDALRLTVESLLNNRKKPNYRQQYYRHVYIFSCKCYLRVINYEHRDDVEHGTSVASV